MRFVAILALLSLVACDKLSSGQRDEVADIASSVVSDQISESPKVAELEARIVELERKVDETARILRYRVP